MLKSRYRRVLRFFSRLLLRQLWWELILPKAGFRRLVERRRPERLRRAASAFRALAVRMGGVLIKVGQFLSSRLDVLPREITTELAGLQDEVGAESFEEIRGVIEAEFGLSLEQKYAEFNPLPMASASIGQVHYARLCASTPDGQPCPPVVVKVQRPRIRQIVEADLAAIRVVGGWLARFKSVRRRADVPALIEEFGRALYEEIDYLHEGKNAELFAQKFKDRPEVQVPAVIWSHTTLRVLTLQDVGAIKIGDYAAIEAAGIDRREVAGRLLDTYLQQIFEDGFFHADPHPGNLFVLPAPAGGVPGAWRLVFIDFGMTGTLPPQTFAALREALVAAGTQDAGRLVRAFLALDLLLPGADLELIERASRKVFERIWGKSTKEMTAMRDSEAREFVEEFGELLYELPFQVPESLILLGRCVSILSGMASGLDADFNLWKVLTPYARKLVEADGGSGLRLLFRELASAAGTLLRLPKRAESLVTRLEQGKLEVRLPELKQYVTRFERVGRKLAASILFASVLFVSTAFYLTGHPAIAAGFGVVDLALLLWLMFGR
jgi:predicted unusual protein kinase regulating ubiquinone biosynthesis (AarF/ABC1/UbiB family)